MASWTNHKARIYEYGASLPGDLVGTITRLITAEGENPLDAAGKGWIKIHGADTPSVSLCQKYRLVRVTAESSVTEEEHEIACFIIGEIKPEIVGRHVIYTVSGPDFVGNIKWANIGFNVISDNAGGPSSTPIVDVLQLSDKSWSVTSHGTAPNGAVHVGAGETGYVVLVGLILQMNAHFSFNLFDNPAFRLHIWYEFTESSGTGFDALTLVESDAPEEYYATPGTAVITSPIVVTKEPQEIFTRAYIYGAGMGADRWTFKEMNLPGFTFPGYGLNTNTSLIINQDLEASGVPVIATTHGFPHLEPEDASDSTAIETNARAIFYSGLAWLKYRAKDEVVYYEIRDLIIHGNIIPGQLVHVTYNRSSPVNAAGSMVTTEIINLDDDLIVMNIRHRLGAGGIRYTDLIVGDTPKRPSDGLNMMAEKLKDLEQTINHTNAGSGGGTEPGSGSSTYLWAAGSGPVLTGDLLVDPLVTIDGVDISAHAADYQAHHEPGTIAHDSVNATTSGTETHAVSASAAPGAAASLLKSSPAGGIELVTGEFTNLILTDRDDGQAYNIFIDNGVMFIEPV